MLASVVASALVSVLLASSDASVRATTTSITCSTRLKFAENKEGKSPCTVWAEMRNVCDKSSYSNIEPLVGAASYTMPGTATRDCDCNLEAYNNMAACTLCQDGQKGWPNVALWKTSCPTFDNSFLFSKAYDHDSSTVSDISMNFPPSVSFYRPNVTWEPNSACRMSYSNWDECDTLFGTMTSGGSGGSTARPTRRPSSGGGSSVTAEWKVNSTVLWIIVAVCVALPALAGLIALIVYCRRQTNRKKFYGPLAAYYEAGGAPPQTAWQQNSLMTTHFKAENEAAAHSHVKTDSKATLQYAQYPPTQPYSSQTHLNAGYHYQHQYDYPYKA